MKTPGQRAAPEITTIGSGQAKWLSAAAAGLALVCIVVQVIPVFEDSGDTTMMDRLLFTSIGLALFAIPAVLGVAGYVAARRGDRRAWTQLRTSQDVDRAAGRLAATARRLFAPKLTVIKVHQDGTHENDEFALSWQRAVYGLAAVSDVLIIDVSMASPYLLWEITNIKPLFDGRQVFVGQRDLVAKLATAETLAADTDEGTLARLLQAEHVLVYDATSLDRYQFARSLRRWLEAAPPRG